MKRFTHEDKAAWIERGKTAFIVFLCFCCVYLLLSVVDLYKGQISLSQFFWGSDPQGNVGEVGEISSKNIVQTYWQLSSPETIVVNCRENRDVLLHTDERFSAVAENINMILRDVHYAKTEEILTGDSNEWKKALRDNSVYIRYAGERVSAFDAQFYEVRDSSFLRAVTAYSEVVIVPLASTDDSLNVLVRDTQTDSIVKLKLETECAAVKKVIGDCVGVGKRYSFAFELDGQSKMNLAPLDDMLLLPLESEETKKVAVNVPRAYKGGVSSFTKTTQVATGFINIFGYNPNTVRQYSNADGALIFVAETGSLSLHPEGRIEYKALGENEGVLLSADSRNSGSAYSVVAGMSGMLDKIFNLCGISDEKQDARLMITSFPHSDAVVKNRLELDYYVDGKRIKVDDGAAISAVIENGVLTELKMWIKNIEKVDDAQAEQPVFAKLEEFSAADKSLRKITSAKQVYVLDKDEKEISAVWDIQGEK